MGVNADKDVNDRFLAIERVKFYKYSFGFRSCIALVVKLWSAYYKATWGSLGPRLMSLSSWQRYVNFNRWISRPTDTTASNDKPKHVRSSEKTGSNISNKSSRLGLSRVNLWLMRFVWWILLRAKISTRPSGSGQGFTLMERSYLKVRSPMAAVSTTISSNRLISTILA